MEARVFKLYKYCTEGAYPAGIGTDKWILGSTGVGGGHRLYGLRIYHIPEKLILGITIPHRWRGHLDCVSTDDSR